MKLDLKQIKKVNKAVLEKLQPEDRKKRYPKHRHRNDHPLARPKLHCVIETLGYDNQEVRVLARVKNVGSGPSLRTKVQFHFAKIPLIAMRIDGPIQPFPDPRDLMVLQEERAITLEPGESRTVEFERNQSWTFNNWQVAVVAFDPLDDPLPMASWTRLMQSVANLLTDADNPSEAGYIDAWEQFDKTDANEFTKVTANQRTWRGRAASPSPVTRTHFFGITLPNPTYFSARNTAKNVSELRQQVNTAPFAKLRNAGDLAFRLSGFVRSYDQGPGEPVDRTEMILECLSDNGTELASMSLGVHDNVELWRALSGQLAVPPGTAKMGVRLRSERRAGTNNDGYFDVVSLIPAHRQISTLSRSGIN